MSIKFKILGSPGRDNAAFLWINSGTRFYRILFDCGEDVLKGIPQHDIKEIDYLFFSHLHLDHAAGFDYFFRRNFDKEKPVHVFGPENTASILHNRLRGFTWNLVSGIPGEWFVTDITPKEKVTYRFLAREGFAKKHLVKRTGFNNKVFENNDFSVSAALLNHIIPSAAYRVQEKETLSINKEKLIEYNYPQGAWLESVKNLSLKENKKIAVEGKDITLEDLRKQLLEKKQGDSFAYLTDFKADKRSFARAVKLCSNCQTVVCENQYMNKDLPMAETNFHLISAQSASIANEASAENLILFHVSERYSPEKDYPVILQEAKSIFPNTSFPPDWNILLNI